MKKMILLAGVMMVSLGMTAQTSPYTGTTPQEGVFYLYNVQSGLWLQNNDSKCNFYQPLGNLGTRGLDINMVASGEGYFLGGGFGRNSLNSWPQTYFDSEKAANRVWIFEAGDASVSNGYTIHCGSTYLRAVKYAHNFSANNLFTQPLDNGQRFYLELPANSNISTPTLLNTWQIVSKEERLAKMVADASRTTPQDASWLVPNADFAKNNERATLWTNDGFTLKGEGENGQSWRMGNSIMQNPTPGQGIPDGEELSIQLTGLPNGIYHFNLQGFYLGGFYDAVADLINNGSNEQRVFYFANNERKALMSPFDEPMCQGHTTGDGTYPLTVQKTYDIGEYTFPPHNSDVLASVVVNRYCGYVNEEIEVVVTDGTLKLGIIKEGDAVANEWTVVDNFHLTYLGTDQTIDENTTCSVAPASDITVKLNRTLSADYWNTFCVPFSMTAEQVTKAFGSDTKITKLKSVEGDVMYFEEATTIEAGMPCLIKPATTTGPDIILSGITMTDTEAQSVGDDSYKFTGTYSPVELKTDGTNLFLQTNGNLAAPADATKTMKGMRAYFEVPANSNARIVFDDGTTTAIDNVMSGSKASHRLYDLGGRQKGQSKGIVIRDGKKYNIK